MIAKNIRLNLFEKSQEYVAGCVNMRKFITNTWSSHRKREKSFAGAGLPLPNMRNSINPTNRRISNFTYKYELCEDPK